MSFLKSILSKKGDLKETIKEQIHSQIQLEPENQMNSPKVDPEVQNIVLLCYAERYKVGEKQYPDYFRSRYGVGFPDEKYRELEKAGYIRQTTAGESLQNLKVADLKNIASHFGIKTTGKKDELCARILESVPESDLNALVSERYWRLTDSGHQLLEANPHIPFYLDNHPYSLEGIGLDIFTYSKLFSGASNRNVQDVLWGEFNRQLSVLYKKAVSKGEFHDYCELLRTMALFLQEEGRHKDALSMYIRYLNYRSNFEAALPAMQSYALFKNIDSASQQLSVNSEIYPFIAKEIIEISNGCEYDSKQLEAYIKTALAKEPDTGMFSPEDLTALIMCGLNGDRAGQESICKKVMKASSKQILKSVKKKK